MMMRDRMHMHTLCRRSRGAGPLKTATPPELAHATLLTKRTLFIH